MLGIDYKKTTIREATMALGKPVTRKRKRTSRSRSFSLPLMPLRTIPAPLE
jgi:hypothetical protein